jgi:hypothetical protein
MSNMCSYQLAYKKGRRALVDLILNGTPNENFFIVDQLPTKSTSHSNLMTEINVKYPKTKWIGVQQVGDSRLPVILMAKIQTPTGLVLAWRNGWNMGHYNFIVHAEGKIYNRMSVRETMDLISILSLNNNELPLIVHTGLCEENKRLVMKRLKT